MTFAPDLMEKGRSPTMDPPPGPRSALLSTLRWMREPVELMVDCAARYGDPFQVTFLGLGTVCFFSGPAAVREILADSGDADIGADAYRILQPIMGSESILFASPRQHLEDHRSLARFFQRESVLALGERLDAVVCSVLDQLPHGAPVSVGDVMQRISLAVARAILFRATSPEDEGVLESELDELVGSASSRLVFLKPLHRDLGRFSPAGRVLRHVRRLDEAIWREIAVRRAGTSLPEPDLLSHLLAARLADGRPLGDRRIRDQLVTFLVSAHVTTPTAMSWAVHWLLREPRVLSRLRDELDAAATRSETIRDLARLPYLDAACRETLRIAPPIPLVSRVFRQPREIDGQHVPAGRMVAPCIYLAARRADVFEDPDAFRPERFLRAMPAPCEFFPFGGGRRHCPGAELAMLLMKLTLARLVRSFEFAAIGRPSVRPVHGRSGVTLVPSKDARLRILARRGTRESPSTRAGTGARAD